MKTLTLMTGALLCFAAARVIAQEPAWSASAIKECDRGCLVGVMDGYMSAIFRHDPESVPPLSIDVRMTENTGQMDVGEGTLGKRTVQSREVLFNFELLDFLFHVPLSTFPTFRRSSPPP